MKRSSESKNNTERGREDRMYSSDSNRRMEKTSRLEMKEVPEVACDLRSYPWQGQGRFHDYGS